MTQRRRVVPEGYVDEAVIEKLMGSFGRVVNECQPTGSEVMTAAVRLVILGLHIRATNGDPSAPRGGEVMSAEDQRRKEPKP